MPYRSQHDTREHAVANTDSSADEVELQNDGPDEPAPKIAEEFPSLKGGEEAQAEEVAQRSADGSSGTRFEKQFVCEAGTENRDAAHEANKANVLEDAIQRGLHPRGEVRFEGAKDITAPSEPGRRSYPLVELTYSVDTIPAAVDHRAVETTTPRDQIVSDDGDTATPTSKPAAGATRRAEAAKTQTKSTAKSTSKSTSGKG